MMYLRKTKKSEMKKYLQVFNNCLQNYSAYRLNFILWRVRVILTILIIFYLWLAVYSGTSTAFGYRKIEMLTYVLLTLFINGIVFSTQTFKIAEEINFGTLSNFLIKPVSYFLYNLARDLADKFLNIFFSVIEFIILIYLIRPEIFIQTDPFIIAIFCLSVISASVLYFEIGVLLSFIGFWSNETWAPRFLFFILVSFLSGMYFPLDIMPRLIFEILSYLPFTYLVYFPLKIFLGHLSNHHMFEGLIISFIWMLIFYLLLKILWNKGLKTYTAEGM